MEEAVRQALGAISQQDHTVVAIVSGRALDLIRARVGLPGLIYAGNHGLEIEGRGLSFLEPAAAAARDQLQTLTRRLEFVLRPVPGVLVEYKVLTTSVHYRKVAGKDLARVEQMVREAIAPAAGVFRLDAGKMLWEILPRTDWNKGAAVRWILDHIGAEDPLSIYFGDDRTDEDAFHALPEGLTFKVGCEGATDAKYRVPGPAAVEEFLEWLASQ
jgi:trehalose 6-phosphate phosphatase